MVIAWHSRFYANGPAVESGARVSFLIDTDRQGDWTIVHLRRLLASEMLLAVVRFGLAPLGHHDRIPQKAPVDGGEGDEGTSVLPLGQVMVAQFAGIMDAERNFAEESGTDAL